MKTLSKVVTFQKYKDLCIGPSIYDVRKKLGFSPPPLFTCVHMSQTPLPLLWTPTCVQMSQTPSPLVDVHMRSTWNTHRSL